VRTSRGSTPRERPSKVKIVSGQRFLKLGEPPLLLC